MMHSHEPPPLARICLDHLRLELDSLAHLHGALGALRRSLVDGDPTLADHRAILAHERGDLGRARAAFRRDCSELTGTANPTLGRIVSRLDEPWAGAVRELRQRLIDLGIETRETSRRVVAILTFCDAFTRRLVAQLVGSDNAVDRYGPDGARLGIGPHHPEVVTGAA